MEDDGGSAVVSAVHPEIKTALRKVILHLDKAYGIKAQKVNNKWSTVFCRSSVFQGTGENDR
jgi:hypothetical protein